MEQPCYKCGHAVEQGVPFCPHCTAPQIRVVIAEAATARVGVVDTPVASPRAVVEPSVPMLAISSPRSQAVRPCALAALIALLLMVMRLNLIPAMIAAGFLAVVFYRRRQPGIPIRPSAGVKLGALAGMFCSGLAMLVIALVMSVPESRARLQEQSIESVKKLAVLFPSYPIQDSIDQLKTPDGFVAMMIGSCIVLFVVSIILAGLGGALGVAILGRSDKT